MSLGRIVQISPRELKWSLAGAGNETAGIMSGEYDRRRVLLREDVKHRSIWQRYRDGRAWEETDLFVQVYPKRFAAGGMVRGTSTLEELLKQYYSRVDAMFKDLKERGFFPVIEGRVVPLPNLHIGHDGEPLTGNNGNHRVAMCQILGTPRIFCKIQSIHANAPYERIPP